jgi:hypothetical protein
MKRKQGLGSRGVPAAWVYLTSGEQGYGREHATALLEKVAWPQGCDQCAQLISPSAMEGARSFKVSRGLSPTTLYLCGGCVRDLCAAGGIPEPEPGT